MRAVFITPLKSDAGFEPMMWLRTQEIIGTLRRLGTNVLPLDLPVASQASEDTLRAVESFRPQFFLAPNFNYFLKAAHHERSLFARFDIPVVALWDDPLGALALYLADIVVGQGLAVDHLHQETLPEVLNKPHLGSSALVWRDVMRHLRRRIPSLPSPTRGSPRLFQRVMQDPRLMHFAWDTGHIEATNALGLTTNRTVRWVPIPTYAAFLKAGMRQSPGPRVKDVAFCGNVYPSVVKQHALWANELLRSLTTIICDKKLNALHRSVWSVMLEEIEQLPAKVRYAYGLYSEMKPFWDYYLFAVWQAANTFVRLGLLTKVKHQVSIYGLFADPQSQQEVQNYPNLLYEGHAHQFDELPGVFASVKINICISNGLVYRGVSSKLIDCLASGGFALTDPKDDLVRLFGVDVERIVFRTPEELNEKIAYFLARPGERAEITRELQKKISERCTLENFFTQVLASVRDK